ncbi:CpaF family protein [Schaalia sp. 19OD2882]|uniref:CpaF family protein n=1 Tax=Schaalia sp. 19OD2882 TaxID=2794089 RepID=UPI001C1EC727|nr:ATPase, T2SS/T4P/T4SS family [Schaalia sp. 19OD2882]QWW20095.1 CpaF family protein [Schaalia sp. 19OD2882]
MLEASADPILARVRAELARTGTDPFASAERARSVVESVLDEVAAPMSQGERDDTIRSLLSEVTGLGPLQPFMDDPSVEEIWINSPSRVFVARDGNPELTTVILTDHQIRDLVERMLHHSGRRLDLSSPFVDATLRSGERLHVVIPPVAGVHWSVNIRKHVRAARSLAQLEAIGMVAPPVARFLAAAVHVGLSVVVSGATQAGKTTVLRALAGEIPRTRRVISCEEVFELGLSNRDCVALQTRPGNLEGRGEVTLRDLVRESLRMRPETIIVGEVRGPEALDLLLALNAGIPGMATVHANSAREALSKLTGLPLLAGGNVTTAFVVPTLAASVDLVCHVHRDWRGRRRLTEVLSLAGRSEGERIEAGVLWTVDEGGAHRGSGGLEMYERFAASGHDLTALLGGR